MDRSPAASSAPRPAAGRVLLVVAVFALLGIGIHLLAPLANGLKPSGLPAGYWIAAQGGPLLLALCAFLLSRRGGGR